MHSVFDVAKYILNTLGEMTTMKLQKLTYYSQAWSLAWDGKPLFNEDFQAWANGPVCVELFNRHQGRFILSEGYFDDRGDITNFTQDEIETLDAVIRDYGEKSSHWLSELTHQEDPWILARNGYGAGARCNEIVTKDSMQQYYGGL